MTDVLCSEEPVDLAAVQADEALIDNLLGSVVITDDALSRALYAWRRDVESVPFPTLVSTVEAVAAIRAGRSWSWRVVALARRLLGGRR